MKISHVIRGDEWMSSTAKHALLYECFGWEMPTFMHMPLLLGIDGKKLSKRRNPTSIFYYKDSGYLSSAFVNFLSLMGYSMPGDKEIYPIEEIIQEFDTKRIGVSGAVFDIKKLDWINQQYIINNIPESNLWEKLKDWRFNDTFMKKLMPLIHTRIKTFGEFMELCGFLFINNLTYREELFKIKELPETTLCSILQSIIWLLEEKENWNSENWHQTSKEAAELFGLNHKKVIMPLLFAAIMGKKQGPPFFSSVEILGKEQARARLIEAITFMGGISNKKMAELRKCFDKKELIEKKS